MPRYINWLDSWIHNPKVGSSSLPLGTMVKKKRGLTPQGWHNSPIAGKVHYQSGYERKFMEWMDVHQIDWIKCKERFPYIAGDGKVHKYNPDFYLPSHKLYVEVKGMVRMNDPAKFEAFPSDKNLVLLGYEDLKKLGLDVKDPVQDRPPLQPGQWPYNLLQQMPDFMQKGELTEELKSKVSSEKFFRLMKIY